MDRRPYFAPVASVCVERPSPSPNTTAHASLGSLWLWQALTFLVFDDLTAFGISGGHFIECPTFGFV